MTVPVFVTPERIATTWPPGSRRVGWSIRGDWRMAGNNPPWTLPPLRRNEVMVTLGEEK